jgi:hypothetical protein
MLTFAEAATVRAALKYWIDEMGSAEFPTTRHYLDVPIGRRLTLDELNLLRDQFAWDRLLFIKTEFDTGRILSSRLHPIGQATDDASHAFWTVIDRN